MEDAMGSKKILLISSFPPSHSAGLGEDMINALSQYGYCVDMLIKYPYLGQKGNITNVLPIPIKKKILDWYIKPFLRKIRLLKGLKTFFKLILSSRGKTIKSPYQSANGIIFIYPEENNPDVGVNDVIAKINEKYDAVITLFWQDFITSETLRAIYDKLKCPILIYAVDMAPITGGCFYFSNCRRFEIGCGRCLALNSNDSFDASHKNYLIKKENYANSQSFFLGNTWMNNFAKKSGIFDNNKILYSSIIVNDQKFSPSDAPKDKIKLSKNYQFIILMRSSISEERKGFKFAVKILSDLFDRLSKEERDKTLIISLQDQLSKNIREQIKFNILDLGKVDTNDLIKAYRTASIFLSPSIDDAGPSMVNQAMMCGTPVAAFEIGTAIDLIHNDINGIIAPLKDTKRIADGLLNLIRNPKLLKQMSEKAREAAVSHNSPSSFAERVAYILNT